MRRTFFLSLLCWTFLSATFAHSQEELGFTLGVHQSEASSRLGGSSSSPRIGLTTGVLGGFLLEERLKFRTGVLYSQRNFDFRFNERSHYYQMDFLDIPAEIQYNFTPTFGLYAGFIAALNTGTKISPDFPAHDKQSLSPLVVIGTEVLVDNVYGFDLFFEDGLEKIDSNAKQLTSFGLNLVYYFF